MFPIQIQTLTVVVFVSICIYCTQGVILRPDWYPYFQDDKQESGQVFNSRQIRTAQPSVRCPPDMTKFECYHELMAVWTRVLKKNRREILEDGLGKFLEKIHPSFEQGDFSNFNPKFPPKFEDLVANGSGGKGKDSIFNLEK